ncbi:MAG: SDR family oxidoreductase [Bryobacteraceae bacterium]
MILLTGGTGFIGRAVLRLLAARPDSRIVVVSRRPPQALPFAADPVTFLAGDVRLPRLGLDQARYDELLSTVTGIIHLAGDIRFETAPAEARAANATGTWHMLELARGCTRLRRFAHVSTVYVHGLTAGTFREEPIPCAGNYLNPYQQTKHEAEALVLEASARIPAAIYRLSTVVADSPAGTVGQFNYVHQLIRHLPNSPLPVIPGDPDTGLDLIDNQWAAAALVHLFENRFVPGSIRHICAGPEDSIPFGEALRRGKKVLEAGSGNGGHAIRLPELVSPAEFNAFLAHTADRRMRLLAAVLDTFLPLVAMRNVYTNGCATADLAGSGIVRMPVRNYFDKVVRYCVDADWGRVR